MIVSDRSLKKASINGLQGDGTRTSKTHVRPMEIGVDVGESKNGVRKAFTP